MGLGFLKTGGAFLGNPVIRIIMHWGLYGGLPTQGNDHTDYMGHIGMTATSQKSFEISLIYSNPKNQ